MLTRQSNIILIKNILFMTTLLKLQNINLKYQNDKKNLKVLNNINLTVKKKETISIVGESGSGKTSLIMLIGGLEIAKQTTVFEPIQEDQFLCWFSHIFAGGYSAGYYSYKWAEVLSADAFSMFEEADLENSEDLKLIGKKFKDTILSLGGSLPPLDIFKLFRGREPKTDSLIRHLGLSGAT